MDASKEQNGIPDLTNNPLEPTESLKRPPPGDESTENPQKVILPGDSATTKAEKIERQDALNATAANPDEIQESPNKRIKIDNGTPSVLPSESRERVKGVAPIKQEYLIDASRPKLVDHVDEDAAEASGKASEEKPAGGRGGKKSKGGQNHGRQFGSSKDEIELCKSRDYAKEFDPIDCRFGDKCRHEHDIRRYLNSGKREDLQTFEGKCPVLEAKGTCSNGWRCRFARSHSHEVDGEDGRKELVLLSANPSASGQDGDGQESTGGVMNMVNLGDKIELRKKKYPLPKSDAYLKWLDSLKYDGSEKKGRQEDVSIAKSNGSVDGNEKADHRASHVDPPLRASEKRKIYYGAETPILAPLTTQGNLPFRRLCVGLGAQVTWSEMAMGMPLIQGEKGEWALMKSHISEMAPPAYTPRGIIKDYDNSKDLKFGAQIAANKPWMALKTTEALTTLCPHLRAIDLNCGCPIDLVYRQGAGSALLDTPGKLEKILRGMNIVSGEVPITVKIRMGTKDKHPTAEKLCQRLVLGGQGAQGLEDGPAGVAAITLHGRSRQQRYSRSANWQYIAECASLVTKLKKERAEVTDTAREPDGRDLSSSSSADGLPYFIGNGDVLSHLDYNEHMQDAGVDSVMIGRGALIKPWIFEEIQTNQYIDKSASERLRYIEQFCRNGLEYWGSDEIGVGTTRRFLLEWLSFSCRYVPLGILEHLPPRFGDRPPAFRGRDDLETILSSANYKDWIKISEWYLGKANANFRFDPKHKSNSYEIEAEG